MLALPPETPAPGGGSFSADTCALNSKRAIQARLRLAFIGAPCEAGDVPVMPCTESVEVDFAQLKLKAAVMSLGVHLDILFLKELSLVIIWNRYILLAAPVHLPRRMKGLDTLDNTYLLLQKVQVFLMQS